MHQQFWTNAPILLSISPEVECSPGGYDFRLPKRPLFNNPLQLHYNFHENVFMVESVNSISISGMLTGQWSVKPRWLPTEGNLVRCTWVLVPHTTFSTFLKNFPLKLIKMLLQKTDMNLNILIIFRQSRTEWVVIYFHENELPNYQETW